MNVLLVEDEPSLREGLTELVSELASPRAASTVQEAVALLDEMPFDLVLADVRIGGDPKGGIKVVKAARERLSPVVVMSALTLGEIQEQLRETPPDSVLLKPFQVEDVLALVERYVRERRALELLAKSPPSADLVFETVEPGVQMAVAEALPEREVRWYRVAPGGEVNRLAHARSHGMVVEGELLVGGVMRRPGQAFHTFKGWPLKATSAQGSLNVSVVFKAG